MVEPLCETRQPLLPIRPARRWISVRVAAIAAAACALVPCGAAGWEVDVHYGLTKWLAVQAGFTREQAELIANGDEGVDDSWMTSPVVNTIASACLRIYPKGAEIVHDNHFASQVDPPELPEKRIVVPSEVWRKNRIMQRPKLSGATDDFGTLGAYLHVLQDSWSHQGTPDIPPFCAADRGWGHAVLRGGWTCHLADFTYRWADKDVPPMAQSSYDALRVARGGKAQALTPDQLARIATFAKARTKWQKDAWFKAQGFADRSFLQGVSLPDCERGEPACRPYPYERLIERWRTLEAAPKLEAKDVPLAVLQLFERFFSGLVEQSGEMLEGALIERTLAAGALARDLHVEGTCPELYVKLNKFALGNGFLDGGGAQTPLALCELAAAFRQKGDAPIPCRDAVDNAQKAITESMPRGPGLRVLAAEVKPLKPYAYVVTRVPESDRYFALARFVHLPRELLLVGAERNGDATKVTSTAWLPSE